MPRHGTRPQGSPGPAAGRRLRLRFPGRPAACWFPGRPADARHLPRRPTVAGLPPRWRAAARRPGAPAHRGGQLADGRGRHGRAAADGVLRRTRRGTRRRHGRARPVVQPAVPVGIGRDLGSRPGRGGRRGPRCRSARQGHRRAARADHPPDAHAARRPRFRVLRRGPGADRADRGRLHPRRAERRRGVRGQALHLQRLRDAALDLQRPGRPARAA